MANHQTKSDKWANGPCIPCHVQPFGHLCTCRTSFFTLPNATSAGRLRLTAVEIPRSQGPKVPRSQGPGRKPRNERFVSSTSKHLRFVNSTKKHVEKKRSSAADQEKNSVFSKLTLVVNYKKCLRHLPNMSMSTTNHQETLLYGKVS